MANICAIMEGAENSIVTSVPIEFSRSQLAPPPGREHQHPTICTPFSGNCLLTTGIPTIVSQKTRASGSGSEGRLGNSLDLCFCPLVVDWGATPFW